MAHLTAGESAAAAADAIPVSDGAKPAPGPGSFKLGGFTIWGVDGDAVTAADFAYDAAAKTLTVNTDRHFALQTDDQTIVGKTPSEDNAAGVHAKPNTTSLVIPAGQTANITLAGVGVRADNPFEISKGATCNLVLADQSYNSFASTGNVRAGIHNPTGATLTIDDSIPNKDASGNPVVPVDGLVPADLTLANGMKVKKGDPLSSMDSKNPGVLYALAGVTGDGNGAGIGGESDRIGGDHGEAGGSFTMYGGIVTARCSANKASSNTYCGAGIGGGGWSGDGTGSSEWITINGGRLSAIAGHHGAGIGSGNAGATGNIRINGGYVISKGGDHGSGFGAACQPANSSAFKIVLTGGTLIPSTVSPPLINCGDIGAPGADITITGGSIGNGRKPGDFSFVGSAHNAQGEPIEMIQVDLTSDVGENTYKLTDWQLLVDGEPFDYGAPAEFDKGHLYLWLPQTVKQNSEVTVNFTYLDTNKLDENGNPTPVTPLPLFRPPDSQMPPDAPDDGKLRRYADFTLDDDYLASLNKYYDGKGAPLFTLPLRTPDGRNLTDADAIKFKYQRLDDAGNPVGTETDNGADVGRMRFTAISTQYSKDTANNFSESYWGHRAVGDFTISPIASIVRDVRAEWVDDKKPGLVPHPSDQVLRVEAIIDRAPTVDGEPNSEKTKGTCQAPRGRVQIYVDGEPVGAPEPLVFAGDLSEDGKPIPAGDPRINATVEDNGAGGTRTHFSLARAAATSDFLVPTQGQEGRHEISLQFLPPSDEQAADGVPANYLESANPTEDPTVPRAEVAIDPIDPNPTATLPPDPGADPSEPQPSLDIDYAHPTPDKPGADPSKPGDKTYHGDLTLYYKQPDGTDPNPGRVEIKLDTPSSGPITVTTADGRIVEAEIVLDEDGKPLRDDDGKITLVVDPVAVGSSELVVKQEPNGAFTGSTFVIDVTVKPEPKIAPAPALSKRAENLTHPNGPTQPGDRIRYTIEAANSAAGSLWTDAVVTDPLPACLALDETTVRLANPYLPLDGPLAKTASARPQDTGKFSLSIPGADGRPLLTVPLGAVPGNGTATVTFEAVVRDALDFADPDVIDLENIASATGTRPSLTDPDKPMEDPDHPGEPLPVDPAPTKPATPPGPASVVPADPAMTLEKSVENVTEPEAKVTRQGDILRYTVALENTGAADSCLVNAVISDPLPEGLEPVAGTLRLAGPDANGSGSPLVVSDDAYDRASRTIAVMVGDVWGGQRWLLTFDVVVGAEAVGAESGNVAFVHGTVPSVGPDGLPGNRPAGEPAAPPSGEPVGSTDPAEPPILVGDDPADGAVSIVKMAENTTSTDGKTRVGDVVRYRIQLANDGPATSWMDVVVRDDVPRGLEPVAGTIALTLPDGRQIAVDDEAYNHETRRLSVATGHLYGGRTVTLVFDAVVTAEAVGSDIGNVAVALGMPPSRWDPAVPFPEPGSPFDPDQGWDAFDESRETVASPAAYPPGVTAAGGVLDGTADEGTTIRHARLAQTSDTLALAALLPVAALLAAGAALLASHRRLRRVG